MILALTDEPGLHRLLDEISPRHADLSMRATGELDEAIRLVDEESIDACIVDARDDDLERYQPLFEKLRRDERDDTYALQVLVLVGSPTAAHAFEDEFSDYRFSALIDTMLSEERLARALTEFVREALDHRRRHDTTPFLERISMAAPLAIAAESEESEERELFFARLGTAARERLPELRDALRRARASITRLRSELDERPAPELLDCASLRAQLAPLVSTFEELELQSPLETLERHLDRLSHQRRARLLYHSLRSLEELFDEFSLMLEQLELLGGLSGPSGRPQRVVVVVPPEQRAALLDDLEREGLRALYAPDIDQALTHSIAYDPAVLVLGAAYRLQDIGRLHHQMTCSSQLPSPPVVLLDRREEPLDPTLARLYGVERVFTDPGELGAHVHARPCRSLVRHASVLLVCGLEDLSVRVEVMLEGLGLEIEVMSVPEVLARTDTLPRHDLILFDVGRLDDTHIAAVGALRRAVRLEGAPILAMVSRPTRETRERLVRAGVASCLLKPIVDEEVLSSVRHWLRFASLEAAGGGGARDGLTGLHAAPMLSRFLADSLRRGRTTGRWQSLVALDLDDGLDLLERHGALAVESALRGIGDTLRVHFADTAAHIFRSVADEFYILQTLTSAESERVDSQLCGLMNTLRRQTFASPDGRGFFVSLSAGQLLIPPLEVSTHACLTRLVSVLDRARRRGASSPLTAVLDPETLEPPRAPTRSLAAAPEDEEAPPTTVPNDRPSTRP